jgi:hypothetical protein
VPRYLHIISSARVPSYMIALLTATNITSLAQSTRGMLVQRVVLLIDRIISDLVHLKALFGPGDQGEPSARGFLVYNGEIGFWSGPGANSSL